MPQKPPENRMKDNNLALSALFHHMADCYRYLGKDERFRAIAYENASKVLLNRKEDIAGSATSVKSLDAIGGIGESIAEKIIEYLNKGFISTFEVLKKKVPYELLELMDIKGFGPATLKTLHDELKIRNRDDLYRELETGRLKEIKGFGETKIENMRRALKLFKEPRRMLLKVAERVGNEILQEIKKIPGVQKAALAGSLRRKKETIGDIDIVILANPGNRKKIVRKITEMPQVERILAKGGTKVSLLLKDKGVQVDIRLVHAYEYGSAMLYFTGSKEHNIKLRTIARGKGLKINEYGLFDSTTGKRLAGSTEEEMYHVLNLKYIPPEKRLGTGEMERAVLKNNQD